MPSRVVCFVCGSLGGEYGQLHSKPPQGRKGDKINFDGIKSAYFPFLEHHDPPQGCRPPDADGLVDSCRVCHAFLTQQWANYERSNTPAVKRLYWLKRLDDGQFTGAEMKLQGEYMAQVMGLQYQPTSDMSGGVAPPQALSPDSRDGVKCDSGRTISRDSNISAQGKKRAFQDNSVHYGGEGGDVLDLSVSIKTEPSLVKHTRKVSSDPSMDKVSPSSGEKTQRDSHFHRSSREKLSQPREPEFDEYVFVCFTCGVESSGVAAKFVSSRVHAPGEPHFPFLARLIPCEGAFPMTAQGVCRVCDLCFSSLCHQWLAYEQHGTPSSARIFRLNNLFFSNDASLSMSGGPVGKSQNEGYDSHALNGKKESGTLMREGTCPTNEDFNQRHIGEQRECKDDDHHESLREVCYLCSQLWSPLKMCPLYTSPTSSAKEVSHPYFPFIRELRRPQGARPLNPDGSVRVCISCNNNLQTQWLQYQSDGTPNSKRRYSLLPPSASAVPLQTSYPPHEQPLKERIKSPEHPHLSSKHLEKPGCVTKVSPNQPLHLDIGTEDSKSIQALSKYSTQGPNSSQQGTVMPLYPNPQNNSGTECDIALPLLNSESRQTASLPFSSSSTSLNTIPHPLQQAGERPKKVCFLCGEKCLSSKSQVLYAYPARHEAKTASSSLPPPHVSPFFPFISSREPAPNSEPMAEDGGIITCAYCYYSLLNQWRDYEEGGKRVQSTEFAGESSGDNRWLRRYSLTEFACFVCGNLGVPRRSMRTLEVHKFGFLREHRAPPQALVMLGGESVGCCSLCHYSLTHQLAEYERLGLPPELRKYNWTVQQPSGQHHHHLDENSCDTQDSTQDNHNIPTGQAELNTYIASEAEDSNQGPPGASKPLLNVPGSPHVEVGKLPPKTATVPPLNHHTSSGGNTSVGSSGATLRTSGFAAALRKLAHQAKDSTDDPNIKQTGSPTDRQSPRDMTPKLRGQSSSQLNFPAWPLSSAPVVTIAPTQSHPAHQQHKSRSHDRATPQVLSGNSSYEQQPPSHHHLYHHYQSHHQEQHQHRSASPSSKIDSREQNHSSRQASLSSLTREENWTKDGQDSRSSSRITPQASTSSPPNSGSFSLNNHALSNPSLANQALPNHGLTREALDLYARGFSAYRPEEEALRLGLAGAGMPYGIDPAAYAAYAAAAAAYHPAILQQQAALVAHSPYRFEDPLLLERYRLLQASSPYLAFPGLAGLSSLAGLGLHPALAAAAATGPSPQFSPGHLPPPELLQRYPHTYLGTSSGQQHPLLDPLLDPRVAAAQAAMLERSRIDEEKARDLREIERSRDDRKRLSTPGGSSSIIKNRSREPGEREPSRHASYESQKTVTSESSSIHDQAHNRHLTEQRDIRREEMLHHHHGKFSFSDSKLGNADHNLREPRAYNNPSRESHIRHEPFTDAHPKDSQAGSSRNKISPQSPYTNVIKPYDRVVDQQLSLGESSVNNNRQDSLHDRLGRRLLSGRDDTLSWEKHDSQMLSPPIQRSWSSTSPSSHQSHHHQHQTTASKEKSNSDFFRPFDDHVNKKDNNLSSMSSSPAATRTEKKREALRATSTSSLPSAHHHSPTDSSNARGSHTSSFSANILSIPSVKVHPHHWLPSVTSQHDSLPQRLPSSQTQSSLSSKVLPPSSPAYLVPPEGPPPLLPSLQIAGVVSEITAVDNMPPSNPFLPTISRCITDRIERFDFKSLAQECTASAPGTANEPLMSKDPMGLTINLKRPVSKLDRREAAFRVQKRRRRLGVDTDGMSSFICIGEECGDEEEERVMTRLTMINRASPLSLDIDPSKLDLFGYLGLTTHKRKRELEIKKERRRRRKLRMASLSPVRQNKDSTQMFDLSVRPISSLTTELGVTYNQSQMENKEHKQEDSHEKKEIFLSVLGLRSLTHDKKVELSRQRKVMVHLGRNGYDISKTHKKTSGNSGTSHSSLPSSLSTTLVTIPCNKSSLDKDSSQRNRHLINAGLATKVKSLHSFNANQHGNLDHKSRLDKDLSVCSGMIHPSSQLSVPQYNFMPNHGVNFHLSVPFNAGLIPASCDGKSSQIPLDDRGSLQAAEGAAARTQTSLSAGHSGIQSHHFYSSRSGVPTAAVSGQSQVSDTSTDTDPRYRLPQAVQQNHEGASSQINSQLSMRKLKLSEADMRNTTMNDASAKPSSHF